MGNEKYKAELAAMLQGESVESQLRKLTDTYESGPLMTLEQYRKIHEEPMMESKCPSAPLKCPCCGADLMQCDRGKSCRCHACMFRCERVHLSHISAAMDAEARLAKVEKERDELQKKLGRLRDDFTQWRSTHDDGCGQ